mmetsp:Transcript_7135/g.21261  ORF Transcript_7135/g.21261 Transcript_7135/m.21261 type:complete len:86 (+) Transcript_7135:234-491(+)
MSMKTMACSSPQGLHAMTRLWKRQEQTNHMCVNELHITAGVLNRFNRFNMERLLNLNTQQLWLNACSGHCPARGRYHLNHTHCLI